jgi:hypothetical protein
MKWLRIAYNGRMKIKNAFVVSDASFVALCASFGTAHGAENPANGLLMKTFEFGANDLSGNVNRAVIEV